MSRIPCLDGLRAVSIALVVFAHAWGGHFGEAPDNPLWIVLTNGALGVEVFFVISGFLITTLLVREHEKYGAISLRNFYIRRLFRIFPPFYAYVAVIAVVAAYTAIDITAGDVISALSFTWNYSPVAKSWSLAHSWSLSVEEQFYLLWPLTMVLVLAKGNRQTAAKVAFGLIVAAPILRLASHATGHAVLSTRIYVMLHTRVDALMFGCLLALLDGTKILDRVMKLASKVVWLFPIFVLVVSPLLTKRFGGKYIYIAGYTLEGGMIALTTLWLIHNPKSLAGRLLSLRPVVHIGLISYSLYLWQQIFLHPKAAEALGSVAKLPLNLVLTFVMAELSYQTLERWCLVWRERFLRKREPAAVAS
jgi:peptidoglycan/LPS O-acetylase OafA/YrhL